MLLFRILLIVAAAACVTTAFAGEQPPITSEDDAACRPKGAPGTEAYIDCRHAIVEAREVIERDDPDGRDRGKVSLHCAHIGVLRPVRYAASAPTRGQEIIERQVR